MLASRSIGESFMNETMENIEILEAIFHTYICIDLPHKVGDFFLLEVLGIKSRANSRDCKQCSCYYRGFM